MTNSKPIITVFGATGRQGGGVAAALRQQGRFAVRAVTRNAAKADVVADVVEADLTRPETLPDAMAGAYGVFLVTNFWAGPDVDEYAQGKAAVEAAAEAGVTHFVWSTLPNVAEISSGKFDVAHFTNKARVDAVVAGAGFRYHTFVEAPFYYQNLATVMQPQPLPDGSTGWAVPMDPSAKVLHMGDITELGNVVAGAFANPERVGDGQHLSFAGDRLSWNDIVDTLAAQGHRYTVTQVPNDVYDGFFPGAQEMRHMMSYFEAHTYFGPDAAKKIAFAREVATAPPTSFADWAKQHMPS